MDMQAILAAERKRLLEQIKQIEDSLQQHYGALQMLDVLEQKRTEAEKSSTIEVNAADQ